MKRPKIVDHRRVTLEDVNKKEFIPFLGGRPNREKIIKSDDIINLTIALNSSKSFEEFLKIV